MVVLANHAGLDDRRNNWMAPRLLRCNLFKRHPGDPFSRPRAKCHGVPIPGTHRVLCIDIVWLVGSRAAVCLSFAHPWHLHGGILQPLQHLTPPKGHALESHKNRPALLSQPITHSGN